MTKSSGLQRLFEHTRPGSEYDEMTPECDICGEVHVGINTECTLLLQGSYVPNTDYGTSMFVLDPDVKIDILQLPNGQLGLLVDRSKVTAGAHTECLDQMRRELFEDEFEEEEIEEAELDDE